MIVLHTFAPSTPAVRQQRTWQSLEPIRRHGRYVVVDAPLHADDEYAATLNWCRLLAIARRRPLCLLEHDVVAAGDVLVELEQCTAAAVCTQAVPVGHGSDRYLFRIRLEDGSLRWGYAGEEWADAFPLACTVFRPDVLERVGDLLPGRLWHDLDHWLSLNLGIRAHVHWPALEHYH